MLPSRWFSKERPSDKTIIFGVDQERGEDMCAVLNNLNADIAQKQPNFVVRIVSDEGKSGRGYVDQFTESERTVPTLDDRDGKPARR